MVDFNGYTVEELTAMREDLNAAIKAKRAEEKESEKASREARAEEMRAKVASGELKEGAKVSFLYNKERTEGTVVRTSEKSVTVKFEKDGEETERYRKYFEILEVLG
jgi:hypothetical protein